MKLVCHSEGGIYIEGDVAQDAGESCLELRKTHTRLGSLALRGCYKVYIGSILSMFRRPVSSIFTGGETKRKSHLIVQFVFRSKHSASQLECVGRK
jgi:hypothetical protein